VFDASIPTGPVTRTDHPADTYNRALERDYSAGDIPHVFVTSYGLRVAPNSALNVCEPAPNSGVSPLIVTGTETIRADPPSWKTISLPPDLQAGRPDVP